VNVHNSLLQSVSDVLYICIYLCCFMLHITKVAKNTKAAALTAK